MSNQNKHWTQGGTGIKNFHKDEYLDYVKALGIFELTSVDLNPVFKIRLVNLDGDMNSDYYSFHWTDRDNKADTSVFFAILRTIQILKKENSRIL